MNSRIERAASCGLATTTRPLVATSATGAKLDTGSKGSDLLRARKARQAPRFESNRAALVDPAIFAAERERIFERCWLYVGHESEVRAPGDFKTRTVCGRPILFCRDSSSELRVFLNSCRHRGTVVCREAEGNAQRYTCFYHGWTYDRDGRLYAVPGQSAYPPNFDKNRLGLVAPPRGEVYRGFVFLNFDANAVALKYFIGRASVNTDLVLDP